MIGFVHGREFYAGEGGTQLLLFILPRKKTLGEIL